MRIYCVADHRGARLLAEIAAYLKEKQHDITMLGPAISNPHDDYPDRAKELADALSRDPNARGIALCGSGIGIGIALNRVPSIRCGLGFDAQQVEAGRRDDDINVLALAADFFTIDSAKKLLDAFLDTPFNNEERHKQRIAKLSL